MTEGDNIRHMSNLRWARGIHDGARVLRDGSMLTVFEREGHGDFVVDHVSRNQDSAAILGCAATLHDARAMLEAFAVELEAGIWGRR